MRSINHALTGAVIGLTVPNPAVAMVAAVLSHFVCDVIPHYGEGPEAIKTNKFRNLLFIDAGLCFVLVLVIASSGTNGWLVACVCAFLAAAPDFASINRFRHARADTPWQPGWFTKFATSIQWFERPIGAVVEVVWFVGGVSLLIMLL